MRPNAHTVEVKVSLPDTLVAAVDLAALESGLARSAYLRAIVAGAMTDAGRWGPHQDVAGVTVRRSPPRGGRQPGATPSVHGRAGGPEEPPVGDDDGG